MSPELIQTAVVIAVAIVVIKTLFSAGKKLIGFFISIAVTIYILREPLWPYIKPIIEYILNLFD